jgi:hypothetical protein
VVPLDLLLLVDTSGSMNDAVATRTKWLLAGDALSAFVQDPRSAGLGIGLQFFPVEAPPRTCNSDADCGLTGVRPNFWCHANHVCYVPGMPLATLRSCDPMVAFLCRGPACRPLGRCSQSGLDCIEIGQACPGGIAGDTCTAPPKICQNDAGDGSCVAGDYARPVVPIATLPMGAAGLTGALGAKVPRGATPMGPAAQGALDYLRMHLLAHPGRRAALVMVSDGLPQGCQLNDDIEAVAAILEAGRSSSPSIPTYVIGVFNEAALNNESRAALERLAMAGGAGTPFLVSATADLTQRFLESLNQIRGTALACEFNIPPPTMGQIDYGKVNVRVAGTSGPEELPYVGALDRCDPVRGGWYYDLNPASATPTRVIVCPASCGRLQQGGSNSVELSFGCRTRTID